MEDHTEEARAEAESSRLPVSTAFTARILTTYTRAYTQVKIAVWTSLAANLALCVLQCTPPYFYPYTRRHPCLTILFVSVISVCGNILPLAVPPRHGYRLCLRHWLKCPPGLAAQKGFQTRCEQMARGRLTPRDHREHCLRSVLPPLFSIALPHMISYDH